MGVTRSYSSHPFLCALVTGHPIDVCISYMANYLRVYSQITSFHAGLTW